MCLTIPAQIIKINKNKAFIKEGKRQKTIGIAAVNGLKIKDWVLYADNSAVKKIGAKEAQIILKLLKKGGK